jgi:hypothetical protein
MMTLKVTDAPKECGGDGFAELTPHAHPSLVDFRDGQGGCGIPVSFSLLDEATPQYGKQDLIGMQDHSLDCHTNESTRHLSCILAL